MHIMGELPLKKGVTQSLHSRRKRRRRQMYFATVSDLKMLKSLQARRRYPQDRWSTWQPVVRYPRRSHRQRIIYRSARMTTGKSKEVVFGNLARQLLTEAECEKLKKILQYFRVSQSVPTLCNQLRSIVNTQEKILLLIELSNRLESQQLEDFHGICALYFNDYPEIRRSLKPGSVQRGSKLIMKEPGGSMKFHKERNEKSLHLNTDRDAPFSFPSFDDSFGSRIYQEINDVSPERSSKSKENGGIDQTSYADSAERRNRNKSDMNGHVESALGSLSISSEESHGHSDQKHTYKAHLQRRANQPLGLGVKGGKESETPIIVDHIDHGGQADQQGIQPGDRLLNVNGHDFRNYTHLQAIKVIKSSWNLTIVFQRTQPIVGDSLNKENLTHDEKLVVICPTKQGKLGCSIIRSSDGRSVHIQNVEPNSPAEKGGLRINDRLIKIDGIKVSDLTNQQIIALAVAKKVKLTIRQTLHQQDTITKAFKNKERVSSTDDEHFSPLESSSTIENTNNAFLNENSPDIHMKSVNSTSDSHSSEDIRKHSLASETKYRDSLNNNGLNDNDEPEKSSKKPNEDALDLPYSGEWYNGMTTPTNKSMPNTPILPRMALQGAAPPPANRNSWQNPSTEQHRRKYKRRHGNSRGGEHSYPRSRSMPDFTIVSMSPGGSTNNFSRPDWAYSSVHSTGSRRYTQNRSRSPHQNSREGTQIQLPKNEELRSALIRGLEKRQKAVQQSHNLSYLKQDNDWEIF